MREENCFLGKSITLLMIYNLILCGLGGLILVINNEVTATNDPVQPASGGVVVVNGNWTVVDTREYYNCTIITNGNLSIMSGGMLTFRNVTLKMNNTENGTFNIEVLPGGRLYIRDYDGDSKTDYDRTVITSVDPEAHFMFWVRPGAGFSMRNSELHECGWKSSNYGLIIESTVFEIIDSYFSNNYYGITLSSASNGIIVRNIITENGYNGIYLANSQEISIDDNTIFNNTVGISSSSSSYIYILRNDISLHYYSGIRISYSVSCYLIENYLSLNGYPGLSLSYSRFIHISDNVMEEDGVYIDGYAIDHWNTHIIDTSNTVNGKPVYYWKNQTAGTIPMNAGQVILANCSNVIIENQEIYNADNGIILGFSNENTIIHNDIMLNFYSGIFMLNSDNNNISFNNISLNGRCGINFERCDSNQIYQNIILSNSGHGIHIYICNFNDIMENTVLYHNSGIFFSGYSDYNNIVNNTVCYNNEGIYLWFNSDYNSIRLNNASNGRLGIFIRSNCNDNIIMENTASFNYHHGIFICSESSRNHVIKNNLSYNGKGIFIWDDCNENQILENQINNNEDALYLWIDCNNNNITRNTALNNERDVFLRDVNLNSITDNKFLYSNYTSIYISGGYEGSLYNEFINNDILMCKKDGIILREACYNNLENNIVTTLNGSGLQFWYYSENNTFINNTIMSEGDYTIDISSGMNNILYHNNIFNNGTLAYDNSNNGNYWDNGYPSGGNYWSDYTGIDLYYGVNQDIPGEDGIGDTPYVIDADSQDNYPFISYIDDYILLHEGWNLFSLPFIQPDNGLDSVFSSILGFYDAVQYFDTTDSEDPWKHNHANKQPILNDLQETDHFKGIWIHVTRPGGVKFRLQGTPLSMNQSISLNKGWNMVGYPSMKKYDRAKGLNNIAFGPYVNCIQWYDALTKKWHFMGSDDNFVPGRGYWIHSKVDTTWVVPL